MTKEGGGGQKEEVTKEEGTMRGKYVSKLVFYAQSTGAVISGQYTSYIFNF